MGHKWQLVTVILTVMAIIVPTYVAYDLAEKTGNKPPKIEYEKQNVANFSLLMSLMDEQIQLSTADGEKLDSLFMSIYSIVNNGGTAVRPEDISESLKVTAPEGWKILGVENLDKSSSPGTFIWERVNRGTFSLMPTLINPGENLDVLIYSIADKNINNVKKPDYEWSARIANAPPVQEYIAPKYSLHIAGGLIVLLSGWAIPFTLITAASIILMLLVMVSRAGFVSTLSLSGSTVIVFISLAGFTVAEVMAFYLFKPLIGMPYDNIINVSILVLWLLITVWLGYRAFLRKI